MENKVLLALGLISLFQSCKIKPKNSEPSVRVSFVHYKADSPKKFCFEGVKDQKAKNWDVCIDSTSNFFDFPLNLNETSMTILFTKNKKIDTLSLEYEIKIEYDEGELDSKVHEFEIAKSTFDSITTTHKPSKIINTNVTESITIYY